VKPRSAVFGESTRFSAASPCPSCNRPLDAAFAASFSEKGHTPAQRARAKESRPHPGALTLCAYCGEILQFTAALDLQRAHLASLDPEYVAFLRDLQASIRESLS